MAYKKGDLQWMIGISIFVILFTLSMNYQITKIKSEKKPIIKTQKEKIIELRATAFHLTKQDIKNYDIDTTRIYQTRYVAISRELLDSLHIKRGDTIEVKEPFEFNGKWIILSVTNIRIKNTIDFLLPSNQKADLWKSIIKIK